MCGMNQLYTNVMKFGRGKRHGSFAVLMCLWIFLGAGCATMRPDFVKPSVSITSFKPIASESFAPKFEIGMHIVNPNAVKLSLRGMSYKVFLNYFQIVEGATNKGLPEIPAYGEADFKVTATVSLFEGMRFVQDLMKNANGQVDYRLQAKLDVGALVPSIQIEKAGSFTP
jgi:LEA14-like dessication related protein